MTNAAILDILNYLCNEARNSVHATFGVMELLPAAAADSAWQNYMDMSRSSTDRLLGSIDDFRDLVSPASLSRDTVEEFDLTLCVGETIELLNLASGKPASHIVLKVPSEALLVRQHRKPLEQMLTRILDTALKLTLAGDIYVSIGMVSNGMISNGMISNVVIPNVVIPNVVIPNVVIPNVAISNASDVQISITLPDSGLAVRLADWLNAHLEQVSFEDLPDMPFPLAVMVAGKSLRTLGGSARISSEPGVPTHLAAFLPSLPGQNSERRHPESRPSSLKVLLTEDCDDSYALSEMILRKESVWRAHNGPEAIDMVKKQRFDIVLMDVHMGGMDGYTAIQAIRDWETQTGNARTPIVILSSDDLETQRQSAARSGCTGFLRKPLRNNDLPDLLDRLKSASRP